MLYMLAHETVYNTKNNEEGNKLLELVVQFVLDSYINSFCIVSYRKQNIQKTPKFCFKLISLRKKNMYDINRRQQQV